MHYPPFPIRALETSSPSGGQFVSRRQKRTALQSRAKSMTSLLPALSSDEAGIIKKIGVCGVTELSWESRGVRSSETGDSCHDVATVTHVWLETRGAQLWPSLGIITNQWGFQQGNKTFKFVANVENGLEQKKAAQWEISWKRAGRRAAPV